MTGDTTNKKTILVTGGCGFIGSNLVRLALSSGYSVVSVFDVYLMGDAARRPAPPS